ncbi:hypothetical protein MTsPCn5_31410 [Croceitalea sp. MTPC5]|uniref:hypothetical protein n=1 Tax=Croceitalea sp. MTPC5 TaxID=3056565 RepID=UPI002B3E1110|nr:hypothetical protein MTsPCn5_31410 [Croceitalea sp. MTPC5]
MKKVLVVLCISLPMLSAFAQEVVGSRLTDAHVDVEGTKISMVPPKGFTKAANFAGFQQDESGSSIMVLDLPGPFSEVSKGFTKEGLLTQGMTLIQLEEMTLNDSPAVLLTAEQDAYGNTYKKYILAFGTEKESILVNGTFIKDGPELDEPIKTALLSVVYHSEKEIDPFDTVDFEINTNGTGFLFAKGMMNALIFNRDGKIPSQSDDQANFIVGKAFSEILTGDKEQFALNRIKQLPIAIEEIVSIEPIEIDGMNGFEIVADGKDRKTGSLEKVYQVMLFTDNLYYILLASSTADFDENIDLFKKMARTFKRK